MIHPLNVRGFNKKKISDARLLRDNSEISLVSPAWMRLDEHYPEDAFIMFPSAELPDERDRVVEFVLND